MVEFEKDTHLSIKAKDYIKEEHEIKKNIYDSNSLWPKHYLQVIINQSVIKK